MIPGIVSAGGMWKDPYQEELITNPDLVTNAGWEFEPGWTYYSSSKYAQRRSTDVPSSMRWSFPSPLPSGTYMAEVHASGLNGTNMIVQLPGAGNLSYYHRLGYTAPFAPMYVVGTTRSAEISEVSILGLHTAQGVVTRFGLRRCGPNIVASPDFRNSSEWSVESGYTFSDSGSNSTISTGSYFSGSFGKFSQNLGIQPSGTYKLRVRCSSFTRGRIAERTSGMAIDSAELRFQDFFHPGGMMEIVFENEKASTATFADVHLWQISN